MEREELRPLEPRRPDAGYDSQGQLIQDLSAWVDLLLYQYYAHHQWLGPDSSLKNMLGLVVSREEFEHNLTRAAQRGLWTQQTAEEQEDAMAVLEAIGARIEKTWAELPLLELMDRFDLDDFAFCCVVLAYLPHVDRKYERLYAYLQDDMTRKCPDTALAVQLFLPWGRRRRDTWPGLQGRAAFCVCSSRTSWPRAAWISRTSRWNTSVWVPSPAGPGCACLTERKRAPKRPWPSSRRRPAGSTGRWPARSPAPCC